MSQVSKNEDTTVKLSKKAMNRLADRAKPFETKKDCLERIISENCSKTTKAEEIEELEEETEAEEN